MIILARVYISDRELKWSFYQLFNPCAQVKMYVPVSRIRELWCVQYINILND